MLGCIQLICQWTVLLLIAFQPSFRPLEKIQLVSITILTPRVSWRLHADFQRDDLFDDLFEQVDESELTYSFRRYLLGQPAAHRPGGLC